MAASVHQLGNAARAANVFSRSTIAELAQVMAARWTS
jgi:hypothetical protein